MANDKPSGGKPQVGGVRGEAEVKIVADDWTSDRTYGKFNIVYVPNSSYWYISLTFVPRDIDITNPNYWMPFISFKEEILLDYEGFLSKTRGTSLSKIKNIDGYRADIEGIDDKLKAIRISKEHEKEDEGGNAKQGDSGFILDLTEYIDWKQSNASDQFSITKELKEVPAYIKIGIAWYCPVYLPCDGVIEFDSDTITASYTTNVILADSKFGILVMLVYSNESKQLTIRYKDFY